MDSDDQFPQPKSSILVTDVNMIELLLEPVVQRICLALLDDAHTCRSLAAKLGIPPERTEEYLNWMQAEGIVIVVGEVNEEDGSVARQYRTSARKFTIDRSLMARHSPSRDKILTLMFQMAFDHVREDIARSLRTGILDLERQPPNEHALFLSRQIYRLTPERARWLQERLNDLLLEADQDPHADDSNKRTYNVMALMYPTDFVEGEHENSGDVVNPLPAKANRLTL